MKETQSFFQGSVGGTVDNAVEGGEGEVETTQQDAVINPGQKC